MNIFGERREEVRRLCNDDSDPKKIRNRPSTRSYLKSEADPLEEHKYPVARGCGEVVQGGHREHRETRVGHHRDDRQQQEDRLPAIVVSQ